MKIGPILGWKDDEVYFFEILHQSTTSYFDFKICPIFIILILFYQELRPSLCIQT